MRALRARFVLVGLLALFWAVYKTPRIERVPASVAHVSGVGDGELFEAVINRVRAGESYYSAMGAELRQRHYPIVSAFNWRTPALFRLLALTSPGMQLGALAALSAFTLLLTVRHLIGSEAVEEILVGVILQAGVVITIFTPAARFLPEAWCGLLVTISVLLFARRRWEAAALAGLCALFVRELAAPYCVMCALLAWWRHRTRELAIWAAGAAAYMLFYAFHMHAVHDAQIHYAAEAGPAYSWVQWGGLPFLVETIEQTNGILLIVPRSVLASAITILAASIWSSRTPLYVRGTAITYATVFAVIGLPFNDYWGFITAPTYAVALGYGCGAVWSIVKCSFRTRQMLDSRSPL